MSHEGLGELFRVSNYSKYKIGIVSLQANLRLIDRFFAFSSSLRKIVAQNYLALLLVFRLWRVRRQFDFVIVREVFPPYMLICNVLLWPLRRKIIFILNHVQQFALESSYHRVMLQYFKFFHFYTINFEISDDILPAAIRFNERSSLIIPHPVDCSFKPRLLPGDRVPPNAQLKLGVVGFPRDGKPIVRLAEYVYNLAKKGTLGCDVVIGTHSKWAAFESLQKLGVPVVATDTRQSYIDTLRSLDIAVYLFEKDKYYYRASGVIADALACGCHVVCSDYPVLKHQIMWPVRVGTTFTTLDDLPEAIREASEIVYSVGQDNHWEYRKQRDARSIAEKIDCFLDNKVRNLSAK